MPSRRRVPGREPITLLLPGGGPLGVAFQAGALIALEDAFGEGFQAHVRAIIGASAGAVTGAFLSVGLTPTMLIKSLSGRFPDEIEYFDPSILMRFDRGRVPNPFLTLWRSILFLLSDLRRRGSTDESLETRQERYAGYLERIDGVINLVPKGWFSLAGLDAFLRRNLSGKDGRLYRFDHLATDLFICATDLTHGQAVLFGKQKFARRVADTPFFSKHQYLTGESLAHAIVCSSAIPFLFVPHGTASTVLADGDTRNTAAVGVAKSLVGARFMVIINPLVPITRVERDAPTSTMFLQTLLTALEGNVVANLKLEFEEKYHLEQHGEASFDMIYFRPSAEAMRAMTEGAIVNLFRYRALNVVEGYKAVMDTMRDHADESRTILRRYGYTFDPGPAERRYALLQRHRQSSQALEDVLLLPKEQLGAERAASA